MNSTSSNTKKPQFMSIKFTYTDLFKLSSDGINYNHIMNYQGEKNTEEMIKLYKKMVFKDVNTL